MKIIIPITTLFISAILISGCRNKDKILPNPTIFTEKTIQIAEQTVPVNGGKIEITQQEDALNGMTIQIPNAAYKDARKFTISYAKITDHKLGPDFNPISPLITISNGGGYSDSVIMISMDVDVPEGEFAMAFLYDDVTGKLEGMPLLVSDGKRVVVATTNFSHSKTGKNTNPAAAQASPAEEEQVSKIVISAVNERELIGEFNSGFAPGVDDMPQVNYGSHYAPGGFCNGQSIAMMWYYSNKKVTQKAPPLYKLMDNDGKNPTPKFWQDDTKAIKLASVIQSDFTVSAPLREILSLIEILGQFTLNDKVTFNAFSYAIKLTREPQMVAIYHKILNPAGHAMVVYKVQSGALYIADPNHPADTERRIFYNDVHDVFIPYQAASRADSNRFEYPVIVYVSKGALIAWPNVSERWKELEHEKIGEGKFPEYRLTTVNDKGEVIPLKDGHIVPSNGILYVDVSTPGVNSRFVVYNESGKYYNWTPSKGYVSLPQGEQLIGIFILDHTDRWMGFEWIRVKVPERKDQPKRNIDVQPPFGEVRLNLKINGADAHIDTCLFTIEKNFFYITGPRNINKAFDVHVNVNTDTWKGVGEYNDLKGWVTLNKLAPVGTYEVKGGNLKIIKWGEGQLMGSFSFTGTMVEERYPGPERIITNVKMEGQFHYMLPASYYKK